MTDAPISQDSPSSPFNRSRPPEGEDWTWSVFAPRRRGLWPGFLENAAGDRKHAVYDPEKCAMQMVDAKDDPLVATPPSDAAELVSWRPFRRATFRVWTAKDPYFEKRVPADKAGATASRLAALTAVLQSLPGSAPKAPKLVSADAEHGRFRFAPVMGRSLHDAVRQDTDQGLTSLPSLAKALTILHQSPVPEGFAPEAPSPFSVAEWLEILKAHAPKLAPAFVEASAGLPVLTEPATRCLVHGDLHDKNIVLSEPTPTFLDWDLAHLGSAADEVANLGAHLVLRALQNGKKPADARGLANRWFGLVKDAGHPAARPQIRGPLAHHFFRLAALYCFRRKWRGLVSLLLAESRRWSERSS